PRRARQRRDGVERRPAWNASRNGLPSTGSNPTDATRKGPVPKGNRPVGRRSWGKEPPTMRRAMPALLMWLTRPLLAVDPELHHVHEQRVAVVREHGEP